MERRLEWKIKQFDELSLNELYGIVQGRFEVFVMEQQITCENDFDDVDQKCHHLFAESEGKIVAYCRLLPKGISYDTAAIGRVLVLAPMRKQGIAEEMMRRAVKYITTEWDEDEITISAQEYIVPLYQAVGFKAVSGVYDEAGIPHVKMKYKN